MNNLAQAGKTGHAVVDALSQMHLEGNIIPHAWFDHPVFLLTEGGYGTERKSMPKVNLLALVVLADIVYWHRASPIRDSETGEVTGYHKRFTGDRLLWDYEKRAARFGCSERQLRDVVSFLVTGGLLLREIEGAAKTVYLTPVVEKIWEVTHGKAERLTSKRESSHIQTGDASRPNASRLTSKRQSYKVKKIRIEDQKESSSDAVGDDGKATLSEGEISRLQGILISHRIEAPEAAKLARQFPAKVAQVPQWWESLDKSKINSEIASVRSFVTGSGHWAPQTATEAPKPAPKPVESPEQLKARQEREEAAKQAFEQLPEIDREAWVSRVPMFGGYYEFMLNQFSKKLPPHLRK